MTGRFTDKYYDAIVISNDVDPTHSGAVKVRIIGLTDDLKDEDQPWAYPSVGYQQAIPTKGSNLQLSFDDGDINKPKYTLVSANQSTLPDDYVNSYPNISVSNLGDDSFKMIHDRAQRSTLITHPNQSTVQWDDFGRITHDSDRGYENAGRGASVGAGSKVQSVLTEGTIDIFCCTPVGNNRASGGSNQGSEYLFVTHVSKQTVGAGDSVNNSDFSTTVDPTVENGVNEELREPIYDTNGNVVQTVEFVETKNYMQRKDKKFNDIRIVWVTNSKFADASAKFLDPTMKQSPHYLIGKGEGSPEIESTSENGSGTQSDTNGFMQYIKIENDAMWREFISNANDSVVIGLLTTSLFDINVPQYQVDQVDKLIEHIQYVAKDNDITIVLASDVMESGLRTSKYKNQMVE